jgi:hypothetical protein
VALYLGPEQLMPLGSILAAIVGVVLMFFHRLAALARRVWQLVAGPRRSGPTPR